MRRCSVTISSAGCTARGTQLKLRLQLIHLHGRGWAVSAQQRIHSRSEPILGKAVRAIGVRTESDQISRTALRHSTQ
jgi:hypothetical protein